MFSTSLSQIRRVGQFAILTIITGLLATTVQAYTLVLRNGRVVEIPRTFSASPTTITYEISPGIQVTLQVVTIDISATEKANRETPGSFLNLLKRNQTTNAAQSETPPGIASRSVTNKQLESFAVLRTKSEAAYARRRKELGLRQQSAREAEADREKLEQNIRQENEREAYWRERATALRAEIAATDAEIQSLRQQLDWLPMNSWNSVTVSNIGPLVPFISFGRSVVSPNLQMRTPRPSVFVAPATGPRSRINVGPSRFPNRGISNGFRGSFIGTRVGFASPFPILPAFSTFGFPSYDLSYQFTYLTTRLSELLGQQAGLQAQWRALEDEARRAGVYPGWLRP